MSHHPPRQSCEPAPEFQGTGSVCYVKVPIPKPVDPTRTPLCSETQTSLDVFHRNHKPAFFGVVPPHTNHPPGVTVLTPQYWRIVGHVLRCRLEISVSQQRPRSAILTPNLMRTGPLDTSRVNPVFSTEGTFPPTLENQSYPQPKQKTTCAHDRFLAESSSKPPAQHHATQSNIPTGFMVGYP